VKWYRKAADADDAKGQLALGRSYELGTGVAKDCEEAVKWYRKAADQNEAGAQYALGNCYLYGRGVVADSAEAVKWYRKAAEEPISGSADAQFALGHCYYYGIGTAQSSVDALSWLNRAAAQGHEQAAAFLRRLAADSETAQPLAARSSRKSAIGSIKVVEFATKITERGTLYVTWAWKITLKNNGTGTRQVFVTIQFVDKEGFQLEDTLRSMDVGAGEECTLTGSLPIKGEVSARISKAQLSLE